MYEFGNKPSKYLANLVKARSTFQAIPVIKNRAGNRVHNTKDINDSFLKFYEQLYTSETDSNSETLTHHFLSSINLPQASDAQKELLNRPVTRQEVIEAIKDLQNNKAPGPDGLTPEFFKAFQDQLIDPLLNMLSYSFESGTLPDTMMDANISLILKKGKPADDCASYRPIALLDVDRKLLAKILAKRLEVVLPDLISVDQTGFILGRNSCNNVRRLLNLIQYGTKLKSESLVVSLDAEKAFDRVEWPYLLGVLSKFSLGDNFIKWISLLYAAPRASVITNCMKSPAFKVGRGTRQGCPASPLLFALAIEPLAEAIRRDPVVMGIEVGPVQHKISLYADDVLLYLSNPAASIARVVNIIKSFGQFSGYKINYSKSEAMPLTPNMSWSPTCSAPFRWSPSGFVYLGIHITSSLNGLYKANFIPLIRKIKEDLARWTALPLSLLGRVNLFKMNILPRLLYPFQMIPYVLTRKSIASINSSLSSFLWRNKRARLKLTALQCSIEEGGMALPDIKRYQIACLCGYLWHWFQEDPKSTWLALETNPVAPVPLRNILYASKEWVSNRVKGNPILQNTLKVWRLTRKLENQKDKISLLTPFYLNPDFPPGLKDNNFAMWHRKGIRTIGDVRLDGNIMSFEQLREKYDLSWNNFFRYLQVRSFITSTIKLYPGGFSLSAVENMVQNPNSKKLITRFYRALSSPDKHCTDRVKSQWEADLGESILDEDWDNVWLDSSGCLSTNKAREQQFRIIHRLQITPSKRNKFNPLLSKYCVKCKTAEGTYFHCIFDCPVINDFWVKICREINTVLEKCLDIQPILCILGVQAEALNLSPALLKLLKVLLFSARRCVLLQWISDTAPTVGQWTRCVMDLIPLEAMSFWFKDKPFEFLSIWEPFLKYIGDEGAQALRTGLYGLAWTEISRYTIDNPAGLEL